MAKFGLLIAGASLAGAMATSAWADNVFVGLQQGGPITQVDSGTDNLVYSGSFGTFNVNLESGDVGVLPDLLDSTTQNKTRSTSPGTLTVWVSYTGITNPLGVLDFKSGLTSNTLPSGWSVLEQTFADSSDAKWGTTTPLASELFTSDGAVVQNDFGTLPAGPYSVTEEYTITATGAGSTLDTIDLGAAATPEPAAWAMMLLGVFGVGAVLRSTRNQRAGLAV